MIWDIIAGILSGIVGSMGLGGGAVLLIYLSLIKGTDQLKAQGINLLFFIPVAVLSVIIYAVKKQINWKIVLILAAGGLVGAAGCIIGSRIVAKIFGGLLVAGGVWQIISSVRKKEG